MNIYYINLIFLQWSFFIFDATNFNKVRFTRTWSDLERVVTSADHTNIPDNSNFNFTLYRQYGTHCATKEQKNVIFNRIISTCEMNGNLVPIAIVQCIFKNSVEIPLCSKPHGNSKQDNRPYFRTDPETLEVINSEAFEAKPKKKYIKSSTIPAVDYWSLKVFPKNPET